MSHTEATSNSPAEMQLLGRSASPANFNLLSLWLCQQIAGTPLSTSVDKLKPDLLKGTACVHEPLPPTFGGGEQQRNLAFPCIKLN